MTAASQTDGSHKEHFLVLDGLRGVAALTVVAVHSIGSGGVLVPNGQFAVDFFFLLSGFVIAYSYDGELAQGMPKLEFVFRRLIRLYPMVFAGAVGGFILALAFNELYPAEAYPVAEIAASSLLSLFALPYLAPNSLGDDLFAFNPPLWSLFFELVANLVYVAIARRLSLLMLSAIVALGLLILVLSGAIDGGVFKQTFWLGFPRVACGFFGGVLLFKLWTAGKLPQIDGNFLMLSLGLLGIFTAPFFLGGVWFVLVFLLLAGIVVCAIGADPEKPRRVSAFLGEISYPIYLIHWAVIGAFGSIIGMAGLTNAHFPLIVLAQLALMTVVGYFVARFYDRPARAFLRRILADRSRRAYLT